MKKIGIVCAAACAAAITAAVAEEKGTGTAVESKVVSVADAVAPAAAAEKPATAPSEEVVATCGGEKITRAELDEEVQKIADSQFNKSPQTIPPQYMEMAKKQLAQQLVSRFIFGKAVDMKAAQLGYKVTPEDEAAFLKDIAANPIFGEKPASIEELAAKSPLGPEHGAKEIELQILLFKMINKEVLEKDATDYTAQAQAVVDRAIEENAKVLDEEAALKKITELKALIDAVPEAERAAKFAEIAEAESACPSGKLNGGSLGEFGHGRMVPEFDKAAFEAEIGAVTGPVKTAFGYHLIMTTKKTPAAEGKGETCEASHILIKTGKKRPVPELAKVAESIKLRVNQPKIQEFISKAITEAGPTAVDEFKEAIPGNE